MFWEVKSQSVKICSIPIFWGGGGGESGVLESQNPKWHDLPKFQFSRGRGVFWNQIPEQGCSEQFGQKFLET